MNPAKIEADLCRAWAKESDLDFIGYSGPIEWLFARLRAGKGVHDVEGLGQVELIKHHTPKSGYDQCYIILKISEKLFRVNGFYDSYESGLVLDGPIFEVKKQIVQRTEFVRVDEDDQE